MSNDNAELLRGTYEAFGRGDIPAVMAVLDENIVWNAPRVLPQAMAVSGRDDVGRFFQKLASTWEDFGLEIEDLVASGDRVCAIGRAGGTLNGEQASYGFVHAWTLRDGICTRFDEYVDPSPEVIAASAEAGARD
jgi:ketosteroid isomerase-like protein